jgi:phytoene synthase
MAADDAMTLIEQVVPDLQVASFFVPAERRAAVLAIFGFEAELSHIALQVAEPMVAQIRYAWWRDQVDAVFAGRDVHAPAVKAIVPVVAAHGLPRALFDELVDGHAHDCEDAPFPDITFIEEYAVSTSGSVMKLVARVLGAGSSADVAAEQAGAAHGLARQLLEYRHWASHGRSRLPADLSGNPGVAVGAVKARITERLTALNALRVVRRARPALAAAAVARLVAAPGFDVLAGQGLTNWQRLSRIALANLTGKP